jgi:hypothetical protein
VHCANEARHARGERLVAIRQVAGDDDDVVDAGELEQLDGLLDDRPLAELDEAFRPVRDFACEPQAAPRITAVVTVIATAPLAGSRPRTAREC